ncbi:MAG: hypothetical protein Q7R41_02885 [Phycisphaerales bacterium]|nr:hypothetical protein [Phycisphaerales bacterium]
MTEFCETTALSPDLHPFQNPGINAGAPIESAARVEPAIRRIDARRAALPSLSADATVQLAELTAARSQYKPPTAPRHPRARARVALALLAALIVGSALVLAEPFQHHCGATFRITNPDSRERISFYRKELLEYAWADLAERPDSQLVAARWFVDEPATGILRVCLTTTDQRRGVDRATVIAHGFLSHLNALTHEVRSTPTEGENILSGYVQKLQTRLSDAQDQLEAAMQTLPAGDPRIDRDSLLARWQNLRSDFAAARARLTHAAEEFGRLHDESAPTHGVVSADERRDAFLADDALQQDFKELAVTLTELKLHLLNVWQRSSAAWDQLGIATSAYLDQLSRRDTDELASDVRTTVERLSVETAAYRDAKDAFSKAWTTEFTSLQHREVDPQSAEVLDGYQRVRTLLNDFLFGGGQRLSAMRSQVNAIAKNPADNARRHVLQSELTRGFQELQSAHHRFEFAAGSIETPENFRIDSALRISRGLRRRTSEQMNAVEERLQAEAAERARKQHAQAIESIDEVLQKTRAASDQTIDELVALQDGLNQTANLSEAFVAAVLRAELANNRFQMTREDLERTEGQLRDLAARRAAADNHSDIALVSCSVVNAAVNLPEQLRLGGVGVGVTFLAVLLGQLLLRRRL